MFSCQLANMVTDMLRLAEVQQFVRRVDEQQRSRFSSSDSEYEDEFS